MLINRRCWKEKSVLTISSLLDLSEGALLEKQREQQTTNQLKFLWMRAVPQNPVWLRADISDCFPKANTATSYPVWSPVSVQSCELLSWCVCTPPWKALQEKALCRLPWGQDRTTVGQISWGPMDWQHRGPCAPDRIWDDMLMLHYFSWAALHHVAECRERVAAVAPV